MKLLLGFGGLLGLILVIAGPLLLFSSFNPLAQANPVVGASLRLWVSTNLTNEEAGGATNKYELFRSDRFLSIGSIPNKNFNQIGRFREVSNLDRTLFQQVIFEEVSDSTWTLSPPSQERLHDNLLRYNESKGINFVLSYEFVRDQPPDQLSTSKELPIINILEEDVEGSEEILRKLTLAADPNTVCNITTREISFSIRDWLIPTLRLPATSKPRVINVDLYQDIFITRR